MQYAVPSRAVHPQGGDSAFSQCWGGGSAQGTVSQVAKLLDEAVAAFHRRPFKDHYPVLMLDGVVLARKTGWALYAARCWWL